jgi:ABC-type transport system substrate-binding protein
VKKPLILLLAAVLVMTPVLCSCSEGASTDGGDDRSSYIAVIWDEPDTVDFQCTTIFYDTAYCVFDRLVDTAVKHNGSIAAEPSLARTWEVSEDGRTYTFHLVEGVKFSNGSPLTSSDVRYTLIRLLTHPDSRNGDIAEPIKGARELENGSAKTLEGFREISDLDFSITLEEPFEAFLACLSMPGASILDEETTEEAGDSFGKDAGHIIGTGSYLLEEWTPGKGMVYKANKDCWKGAPGNDGILVSFEKDAPTMRRMFDEGDLDIMDLDDLDNAADYYIHGDIYQNRLNTAQQVSIAYLALNESLEPLDDVNVRKAIQLAIDRQMLLEVVYDGEGTVENGIFPRGLYGYNPSLEDITYDPAQASALLAQAGYPGGFDLTISVRSDSNQREVKMVRMIAEMLRKTGINANVVIMDEDEFMDQKSKGELACYAATWIADYNDPDNFIYTFYGSPEKTRSRSLCYPEEEIMKRVRDARTITDPDERIGEYRQLEKIIAQDDAAWVPLFSRKKIYVTSGRLDGFSTSWTGRFNARLSQMSVTEP